MDMVLISKELILYLGYIIIFFLKEDGAIIQPLLIVMENLKKILKLQMVNKSSKLMKLKYLKFLQIKL